MAEATSQFGHPILIRGCGRVVEVYAQCGVVQPEETDDLSHKKLLEFSLDSLSRLSINHKSNISPINNLTDHVCIEDSVMFSYNPSIGRIVEVIISVDESLLEKDESGENESLPPEMQKLARRIRKMVERLRFEEGYGTIREVTAENGKIYCERLGTLNFDRRSMSFGSDADELEDVSQPIYRLLKRRQTVSFRYFVNQEDKFIVASVEPLGELFNGYDGVITEVHKCHAIIISLSFGKIFMPYSAFYVPQKLYEQKSAIFYNSYALKVDFTITEPLPGFDLCRWRAITVRPK